MSERLQDVLKAFEPTDLEKHFPGLKENGLLLVTNDPYSLYTEKELMSLIQKEIDDLESSGLIGTDFYSSEEEILEILVDKIYYDIIKQKALDKAREVSKNLFELSEKNEKISFRYQYNNERGPYGVTVSVHSRLLILIREPGINYVYLYKGRLVAILGRGDFVVYTAYKGSKPFKLTKEHVLGG